MRTNRWQLTRAGAIVLASSLSGSAGAQTSSSPGYVELPPPRQAPAVTAVPIHDATAASGCEVSGRGGRFRSAWERWTTRIEQRCVPQEPDPVPLGLSVYQHFDIHVANGVGARMVLHDYDFAVNKTGLTVRGQEQLKQIARWAEHYPFPIIIERPSYVPALGEARRRAVLDALRSWNIAVNADRVVVGTPPSHGLSGVEAQLIYQNLINQTQSRGIEAGSTATSGTVSGFQPLTGGTPGGQGTPSNR